MIFVPVHGTRVDLAGAVVRPAVYELKHGQSLADLIQAAGGFRPDAALRRVSVYRLLAAAERGPGAPPRAVIDVALAPLPHGKRETGSVPPGDPLLPVTMPSLALEDGDSVVVDAVKPLAGQYYVTIVGRVNKPGAYPWREGMTLRDLVLLARGPAVGADLQEAEVARLPADRTGGQLATTERVPLDSTYLFERDSLGRYVGPPGVPFPAKGAPEVPLKPYDNVLILRQPEFDLQRTVIVVGQVRYPGTYSLRTKTDRLADVIARSGGLTRQAYAEGIRFFRPVDNVGRINVNLPRALTDTTSSSNIILQPGDSIEVPEYQPAVKVTGAVNSPGSVLWKKGENLEYYLEGAGGFSYRAEKSKVSVRYANGEVRTRRRSIFGASDPKPGPGSEVFVPVRDSTEKTNYVALFGAIAQILASTVAIVVVVSRK